MPVAVSYDLRQVSQALAGAGGATPYTPAAGFERPFSSLLSIEVIRNLRDHRQGAKSTDEIAADVRARLSGLQGIIQWLFEKEAEAPGLLRLSKKPFRFQASFDPLNAVDLDVLLACELLENRAGLLEALIGLAQPAERRRDAGRCYAGLTLTTHWQSGPRQKLSFKVPPTSREAELGPGSFNLILTNDSPDLRLDPAIWGAVQCQIESPGEGFADRRDMVLVSMNVAVFKSQTMQELILNTGDGGWFVDQAFGDANTAKAAHFLGDLASAAA